MHVIKKKKKNIYILVIHSCTGTLQYQAPEILNGGLYDEKVDLWAVGIITFEMLCGYRPFDSD